MAVPERDIRQGVTVTSGRDMRHLRHSLAAGVAPVISIVTLIACLATAPAVAAPRTVRVGVYENEPKVFTDPQSGQPSGIFVELLTAVAEEEGWQLVWVPGTWEEGLQALAEDRIDLMPDVAYSRAREQAMDFHTRPVVDSWSRIYAAPGVRVDEISHLQGKRVAVLSGSIQETVFAQMSVGFGYTIETVAADSLNECFRLASEGEVDAAIANSLFGDYAYQRYDLTKTSVVFNAVPLFYATAQGRNADLLTAIDEHLDQWIESPGSTYYEVLGRYADQEPPAKIPSWVFWLAGAAGALLLTASVVIAIQRYRIRQERREVELAAVRAEATHRFLANVSHELRTPLNSIIGFSEILRKGMAGPLSEEQTFQVGMIHDSGRGLLELINDILDLSKVQAGAIEPHIEPVDPAVVLVNVADTLRPLASAKGLELHVDTLDTATMWTGDKDLLRRIMLNIAGNAVKYTTSGSVGLRCELSRAGDLMCAVTDTGPGIPPEEIPHVFEAFHTIENPDQTAPKGTGLGLAISQDYAYVLGGEIEVRSVVGEGSTFTLKLPSAATRRNQQRRR